MILRPVDYPRNLAGMKCEVEVFFVDAGAVVHDGGRGPRARPRVAPRRVDRTQLL